MAVRRSDPMAHRAIMGGHPLCTHDMMIVARAGGRPEPRVDGRVVAAVELEVVEVWVSSDPSLLEAVTAPGRRSMRIAQADVDDAFQRWLRDLPDWDTEKMTQAIKAAGIHLVWRRPGP